MNGWKIEIDGYDPKWIPERRNPKNGLGIIACERDALSQYKRLMKIPRGIELPEPKIVYGVVDESMVLEEPPIKTRVVKVVTTKPAASKKKE